METAIEALSMKSLSKLFLALLFVWLHLEGVQGKPNPTAWVGVRSPDISRGFSIYGLKPGDDFTGIAASLPSKGWKLNVISKKKNERTVSIQDRFDHHLLLDLVSVDSKEIIHSMSCYPITDGTSVELNGTQVLFNGDSPETLKKRLNKSKVHALGQGNFELRFGNEKLRIYVSSKNEIRSVSL